jgi:putative CocE/NonD family hydrolase
LVTATTSAAARALRLSPAVTRQVTARRAIAVRARDGVILRTDHYAPAIEDAPTVLVRTPYGRNGVTGIAARLLAERGFHVVMQSCRGTGGSGGTFRPMRHERDDGLDTVDWLRRQPWFNGVLGTYGPSYVGYTQWAIADVPELAAMATVITASSFREPIYAGDSFSLYSTLAWASLLAAQTQPWLASTIEVLRGSPRLNRAFEHLPLREADQLATGAEVAFFREWLELANAEPAERDAYWSEVDHEQLLPKVHAPVLMIGGWHDIFLPWQLHDYAVLQAAGAEPYLTVGPWTHGSPGLLAASVRESVDWLRAQLRGETDAVRTRPVRLYVEGAGEWREYDAWPPPGTIAQPWYLQPGGGLAPTAPRGQSSVDRYRYDPQDPTPTVGGPLLLAHVSGPRDNRAVEARADVLVYTSPVLDRDLEIIGPVTATVHVRGSSPYHDVFVRLCDVEPSGRSVNICDGLVRLNPRGALLPEPVAVDVALWPAAHRFRAGHRIRVQVSGGAHPRYVRNPGTADALATATDLRPVEVEVWHDHDRPSSVTLPVIS